MTWHLFGAERLYKPVSINQGINLSGISIKMQIFLHKKCTSIVIDQFYSSLNVFGGQNDHMCFRTIKWSLTYCQQGHFSIGLDNGRAFAWCWAITQNSVS